MGILEMIGWISLGFVPSYIVLEVGSRKLARRGITKLYEDSQLKLNDKTEELEAMKRYLREVLKEVDKFKQAKLLINLRSEK